MKTIFSYILEVVSSILYIFNDNKKIVFESSPFMTDNTKMIYDKFIKEYPYEYKYYWFIDNDYNYSINGLYSLIKMNYSNIITKIISEIKAIVHLSTCKVYIFSNSNYARFKPKEGQIFINLTHGQSLKNTIGLYPNVERMSYILTLSDFAKELRVKTFKGGAQKMKPLGFPRNDLLYIENGQQIYKYDYIIWLPTFRRQKRTGRNDTDTIDNSDLPIIRNKKEFKILNSYLENKKIIIIIKPHPAQDLNFFKTAELSHIRVLSDTELSENNLHLYNLLADSKALITDYSSVYVDYLLTNKMIGFTIDDIDSYKNNKGFLVKDPESLMPGHKINNLHDMLRFIGDVYNKNDYYRLEREAILKKFHKYQDDDSTNRVYNFIKDKMEEC